MQYSDHDLPRENPGFQRGLAQLKNLLTPDERDDEFDALAAGWLSHYQDYQSPAFDHQLLKLIQTDWLHRRALLSIARAEHSLAWAEAQHEPREQIRETAKFIRQLTRRCAAYEKRFENALRILEALRKAPVRAFVINYINPEPQSDRYLDETPEHN